MKIKKYGIILEIENLLIIILIYSFVFDKIKLFLTSYFICYLFILFHELSHIIFASFYGKKIKRIKLSLAGVCVTFNNVRLSVIKNIIIYIAGPLSNLCLAILFSNIEFIFEINIFLCILNLMPIFPLDGYNILNCIINKKIIVNYIQILFIISLFFISICVFIHNLNPSLFIFFLYVMLIKYVTKNQS